jgi:hypothetical protein
MYWLLATLLAANPGDVEVIKRATNWLDANEGHPQMYQLLAPLLATNPGDVEVRRLATGWLDANEGHPQAYHVLAPLLKANPGDVEVRRLATGWLDANEGHPQMYWLLATLLAANPGDEGIVDRAANWLRANESHPKYFILLKVMIARTDGAPEWLDRGEQYVNKLGNVHPEVVLGVLLTGGKADPKFIEMAFNFLDKTALKSQRHFVLSHLSRALVFNFHNAIRYLDGAYSEKRKKTVCASIAIGMNHFPDTFSDFALNAVKLLAPIHIYQILLNVITRQIENDYLDEMIAQWLIDNYRRQGYGSMLDALSKATVLGDRLLSLSLLPPKVIEDLNARKRQYRKNRF